MSARSQSRRSRTHLADPTDGDRDQHDSLFILDQPSIGLHPLDVQVLLHVLQRLIDNGATVVIANADYLIDLGPRWRNRRRPHRRLWNTRQVAHTADSITGRYLTN